MHAIAFACTFWLVALLLGRRLVLLFRLHSAEFTELEANLVAMVIGAGCLQLVPYVLASAHALNPSAVRLTCVLLLLLLLPDAARMLVGTLQRFRAEPKVTMPTALKIWSALLAATPGIFLVHALAFGNFGDDDGYHLSAPARWLHEQTLSYLPTYTNTNAFMGFEMLYAIALSFGEPVGAKLLNYSAGLWTLLSIVVCARRLGDETAGLISVSALLISTPIINLSYIFPLAYVDFASCWAAVVSVLAWLAWRRHPNQQGLLVREEPAWFYLHGGHQRVPVLRSTGNTIWRGHSEVRPFVSLSASPASSFGSATRLALSHINERWDQPLFGGYEALDHPVCSAMMK